MSRALSAPISVRTARHGSAPSRLGTSCATLSLAVPEFGPRKLYADLGRALGRMTTTLRHALDQRWQQRTMSLVCAARVRALPPRT